MAQIVTAGFIVDGLVGLWYRHGPGRPPETAADLLPERAATSAEDEDAFWADDGDGTTEDDLGDEATAGERAP